MDYYAEEKSYRKNKRDSPGGCFHSESMAGFSVKFIQP
jgi:hypothetical protein